MKLLVLIATASALIFQSIWPHQNCVGPPVAMLLFDPPSAASNYTNEAYSFYSAYIPPYACTSHLNAPFDSQSCCISSVKFGSSAYGVYTGSGIWKAANGNEYCLLNSQEASGLYGMSRLLVREGQCNEGISCVQNGIQIQAGRSCNGNITEYYALSGIDTLIDSPLVGAFMGSYNVLQSGTLSNKWNAYVPQGSNLPNLSHGWDIIALLFYIGSIIVLLLGLWTFGFKFVKARSWETLIHVAGMSFWLLFIILYGISVYVILDFKTFQMVFEAYGVFGNIATFFTMIQTLTKLLEVSNPSKNVKICTYVFVVLIDVIFSIIYYSSFWSVQISYVLLWNSWYFSMVIWTVIVFSCILSTIAFLLYKSFRKSRTVLGGINRCLRLFDHDYRFTVLAIGISAVILLWVG